MNTNDLPGQREAAASVARPSPVSPASNSWSNGECQQLGNCPPGSIVDSFGINYISVQLSNFDRFEQIWEVFFEVVLNLKEH